MEKTIECYIVIPRNFCVVLCGGGGCCFRVSWPPPQPRTPSRLSSIDNGGGERQSNGRAAYTGGSCFFFYVCFRVDGYLVQSSVPLEPVVIFFFFFSDGFGFKGGLYSRELSTDVSRKESERKSGPTAGKGRTPRGAPRGAQTGGLFVARRVCCCPFVVSLFKKVLLHAFFRIRVCLIPRS